MSKSLSLKIENGFAIIEFDEPNSKVNLLSAAGLKELQDIILQLEKQPHLKGALILSKKPDIFIAGADIKEIEGISEVSEAMSKAKAGQDILNALEKLKFPTISLINGVCLGGGLELALASDYRLASFGEKVKLGLPEVKLGIIPGFGGTKRLSQVVGLRKALEMIVSGESISGKEALKIGLVDALVPHNRLLEEGIDFLKKNPEKRKTYKPKINGVNILLEKTFPGRLILKNQFKKFILKTTRGHYPAPLKALEVVNKNYNSSLKKALDREARVFAELAISSISKNLISVFYLIEKYKKDKWVEASPDPIHKCGVVGAGIMGGGISQLFSAYGISVRMKDLNYQALGRGLRQAREIYDYAVKKKKLKTHQANFCMGLISPATAYSGFASADLIVEAVIEDMKIKQKVFNELSLMVKPSTILASNTSCLSISEITVGVKNRERVIGMHFFNPVHRMPLVEIIRAPFTGESTIATLVEFSKKIGKTPIVVKDSCGFLINRLLIPYLDEAGFILEEGVSFEKIDSIILTFGMPMGPFTLMDEIGLDVGYKVASILEENFGARMKVPQILKRVYENKWFGKKSGKGFYVHRGKNKYPNKEIYEFTSHQPVSNLSSEEILKRMLYRMVNEAAMCLEEGICRGPRDVDTGMIMGAGFPAFKGGLLHYADFTGIDNIVIDLEGFREKFNSERFTPCNYLSELARNKKGFYK